MQAIENAVKAGIDEHGDDFALVIEKAGVGLGAGHEFDSHGSEVTDWYQRHDEEGEPVGYDYTAGEYDDGWQADDGSGSPEPETVPEPEKP